MAKHMTFNHYYKGSNPLDLRKKKNINGYRIMVNLLVFQTIYTDSTSVGRMGLVT